MTEITAGKAIGDLIFRKRTQKGWSQLDLALEAFEDERKVRRIVELENGQVARPQARNIGLIARALNISNEELAPCWALKSVNSKVQEKLGISSHAIEELARIFGQDSPQGSSDQLMEFLELKAKELRLLKERVVALGAADESRRELLSSAQSAIEQGQLDEAGKILELCEREHQETATLVQVRKQAEIRAIRAANELLKGDSQRAFEHFSAAADFFDPFDKIEGARIRHDFQDKLHWHGRYSGGRAFDFAEELLSKNLAVYISPTYKAEWARTQSSLALTKQFKGVRAAGAEGIKILHVAISAYDLALTILTRYALPADWVKAFTNRAVALRYLGSRLGAEGGAAYLGLAVDAYETLIDFQTGQSTPTDLARSHTNLAVALTESAKLAANEPALHFFGRAIKSCELALVGYTEELQPGNWARTMVNLGNAYQEYGAKAEGKVKRMMFNKAIAAYSDALRQISEQHQTILWAETMEDVGLAHELLAVVAENEFDYHCQQALIAFNKALNVYAASEMDHFYEKCATAIDRVSSISLSGPNDLKLIPKNPF